MPVLAYHAIFSAYGQWLPNDPRGSGSFEVWANHLRKFGPATGLEDRSRSVAREQHDVQTRLAAKKALLRPAVLFTGRQALSVGRGFHDYIRKAGITVWACAIMPDHVHLVVARHRLLIESIVEQLKGAATNRLIDAGLHPFAGMTDSETRHPTCWARGEWKVFLNSEAEILREIGYVERNPEKRGLPRQNWPFMMPYPQLYDGR